MANIEGVDKRFQNCTLANYESNSENQVILDSLKNYKYDQSLTFLKNTGAGKTHLSIALMKAHPNIELEPETVKENLDALNYKLKYTIGEDTKRIQSLIDSESYKYRPANCLFIPVIRLLMELNEATYKNEKLFFLKKFTSGNYDLICLDDLGTERNSEAAQQNIYFILDERYRKCLNTIVTSNLTLKEIDKYDPRIASRLSEMGQVIEFNCSDYRTRKK